jgi:hypothetical protein
VKTLMTGHVCDETQNLAFLLWSLALQPPTTGCHILSHQERSSVPVGESGLWVRTDAHLSVSGGTYAFWGQTHFPCACDIVLNGVASPTRDWGLKTVGPWGWGIKAVWPVPVPLLLSFSTEPRATKSRFHVALQSESG